MPVPAADLDLDFTTGTLPTGVALSRTGSARATYFNSSGTLSYAPINLATNSADWSNATLLNTTVVQNAAVAPDGNTTATRVVETSATGVHYILRSGITVLGATNYTFSIYVQAQQNTFVEIFYDDSTNRVYAAFNLTTGVVSQAVAASGTATAVGAAITSVGGGWYRCSVTGAVASNVSTGRCGCYLATSGTPGNAPSYAGNTSNGLLVWGGQLELGSTASPLIYTLAAANGAPRFDYDPVALNINGLLIEETRTNLFLQSADYSQSSTNASPNDTTRTANQGVSPDGGTNAASVVPSTGTGTHIAYRTFTGATSTAYTFSVFLKPSGYNFVQLQLANTGFPASCTANVNVSTGSVLATGAGATSSGIQSVGNGWYRCWVTATSQASAGTYVAAIVPYNGGSTSFAGDGTSGVLAWGGQVEAAIFPTSYIPTTTASVQRVNDLATVASGSWLTSTTNVSLAADFEVAYRSTVAAGVAPVVVQIDDGSTANVLSIRLNAGATPSEQMTIFTANTVSASPTTANTWSQNVPSKGAAAFSSSVCNGTLNGGTIGTATPSAFPTGLNRISIGSGRTTPLSGWITRVRYWGQVLSNANLIAAASTSSIEEAASAADAPSAVFTTTASISEAASAADTPSAAVAFAASVSEAASAADTRSATLTTAASGTEPASAADTQSVTFVTAASAAEPATAADAPDATVTTTAAVTEAAGAADAASLTVDTTAAVSEPTTATDAADATRTLAAAVTEAASASDTQDAGLAFVVSVDEAASAADLAAATAVWVASVTERARATDRSDAEIVSGADLYLNIRDDILTIWQQRFARSDVPVFWRSGGVPPTPDPSKVPLFLRAEVDFGREELIAYGNGKGANLNVHRGSVTVRAFSSMGDDEDDGLDLLGDAVAVFRGYRTQDVFGGDLSFTGRGSGEDAGPTEDGIWFRRGFRSDFEYRFSG